MEILPFEEVQRVAGARIQLQQGGDTSTQQYVSGAMNSPTCENTSQDSSLSVNLH